MRFIHLLLSVSFLLQVSSTVHGNEKPSITCLGPQVCTLVRELFDLKKVSIQGAAKKTSSHNPHHSSLGPKDIKHLTKAEYLILPPASFHGNLPDHLLQARDTKGLKTLRLNPKLEGNKDPNLDHAFDHYWLHPDSYKQVVSAIALFAKTNRLPIKEDLLKRQEEITKMDYTILNKLKSLKVVLCHEALVPLLKQHNIDHIILRGTGHDHSGNRIGPEKMKQWSSLVSATPSIVYISDRHAHLPKVVEEGIRSSDISIKIDLEGLHAKGLSSLQELLTKLSSLPLAKEKKI